MPFNIYQLLKCIQIFSIFYGNLDFKLCSNKRNSVSGMENIFKTVQKNLLRN